MKNFKIIPPPQRYKNLIEIYDAYGSQGVVAYSCQVDGGVPEGGFVVAVQAGGNSRDIKEYLRQFKKRFPAKEPTFYLRIPLANDGKPLAYVYDSGTGEKKALPKLEVKKSAPERLINMIPEEVLAKLIETAFRRD